MLGFLITGCDEKDLPVSNFNICFCEHQYNKKQPLTRGHMNGIEKKLWESRRKKWHPIDMAEFDDNAKYLIGWPGYRTSRNKSGLDYVET